MKGLANWILKIFYGIDINSLRRENKRLKEENGRHVSRYNSLKKDKEFLSEKTKRLESDYTSTQERNQDLEKQIDILKSQINEQEERLKKKVNDNRIVISELKASLNDANNENAGLKTSIGKANEKLKVLEEMGQIVPMPEDVNDNDEDRDEIENLKRQYANLQELFEQANKENRELKGKISNQDSTINNLKNDIKKKKETLDSQSKEIVELKKQLQSNSKEDIPNDPDENVIEEEELSPALVTDGSTIVLDPPVTGNNAEPTKDTTKRTIDTVIDIENDEEINAKSFFAQPEGVIFKIRTELEKAIYLRKPKYVCKYCGQMVKISGRKTERGMARFFSHLRDSDDCDYKTTTGRTRREINREKFARCNEGERHKFLKAEITKYLEMTEGVSEVRTENTVKGNHPILRWRRPDVIVNYRGQDVVFELQLSTTFVSVIAERDLFYRLNKKHIIWVSNFDEQGEHVDLTNMMIKDIYYNNRMNIFIFDSDAQRKSKELDELVLKCNWLDPDGDWEYPNGNTSDQLGGKFVRLSDLTFDNTFKPYYVDAEQAYYAAHPEFKLKIKNIEDENKEILAELDKRWEKEQEIIESEQQKTENKLNEIIEENEIDGEIKSTRKYIIAQRQGLYGLITFEGQIRMPFIYDEIKAHRGWYEGKRNGTLEVFDINYELIDTSIRRIEKLGDNYKKYVKETGNDWLWGIMDNIARVITPPVYSKIETWSTNKFVAVQDGLYCILDQNGRIIIGGYDHIGELDADGFATISKDGRVGRIDSECNAVKTDIEKISDNLLKVNKLGKWGLETTDGTVIVPCDYDDLGSFNNGIIGLNGFHFSHLNTKIGDDCPVRVKYVSRNDRKMLIFKVGNREAFMNIRQQQKASKNGLKPMEMTQMFFSHANQDKNLLYLSATPVKALGVKQQVETKDSDIPIGSIVEGSIVHVDKNSFTIKSEEGQTAYLHRSTWGEYSMEQFRKGQMVKVEKIGFDDEHKKHVWRILSVYWPMT